MNVVNWKMIAHPINWIIVLLMLVIAGMLGQVLLSWAGIEPSGTSGNRPSNGQSQTIPTRLNNYL